jgi:hypothetical protein
MWLSRGLLIFIIPFIALSCAPKAKIPPKPPISEKVPTPGEGEKPKEEPRDAILFNLGELLFSQEDFANAGLKFRDLIAQYPSSPLVNEAKYKLGICYAKTGRYEDSLRSLREVLPLSLSPLRKATIHSIMAENYAGLGDYFEALRWYSSRRSNSCMRAPPLRAMPSSRWLRSISSKEMWHGVRSYSTESWRILRTNPITPTLKPSSTA